jgi:hypothetical protein
MLRFLSALSGPYHTFDRLPTIQPKSAYYCFNQSAPVCGHMYDRVVIHMTVVDVRA